MLWPEGSTQTLEPHNSFQIPALPLTSFVLLNKSLAVWNNGYIYLIDEEMKSDLMYVKHLEYYLA